MPEWLGKTIGKVKIEKLLARGGMAEVYLGTHLTLGRPVAIKILHSYVEEDPILLERFHREAKVVGSLRHSHIVQIFDFDIIDGHPYIVMEYLRGPTLANYLRSMHQRKKRTPYDQIARLLKGLTSALDYAHGQGVIHRDIKPSNILLHNQADEIPVDRPITNDVEAVLTDFGLVRIVNAASQTTSGMITGTPAYMSPEQARGDLVDHRTDIYSLGIMLYEMLAGRVPFEADSTMTILHMQIHTPPPAISGIPSKVQAVVERALAKNPDNRYQTSRELAIDLYLAIGMPVQAEILREPYSATMPPVGTAIESSAPLPTTVEPAAPEPLPKTASRAEPESSAKSHPQMEPELQLKSQPQIKPEPQLRSQPRIVREPPKPEPQTEPEPSLKSQPRIAPKPPPVSQPRIEVGSAPKPQPQPALQKAKPPSQPTRSWTWIGVGLLSLVLISLIGAWALGFIRIPGPSAGSTATLAPVMTSTVVSALPTEAPALPPAAGMVEIPAGTYTVGTNLLTDEFHVPPITVQLDHFWIDQYQTTNAEYEQYKTAAGAPDPVTWPGAPDHPVRGVTWEQAEAYCASKQKRLATEAEWEAAGRGAGADPQPYPWGKDPTAGGQAFSLPGDDTYAVGTLAFNKSPFGVFDMVGNVWEWVGEPYAPGQEGSKILRGGRYGLLLDLAYRLVVPPGDTRYLKYAGFRCAADQVR